MLTNQHSFYVHFDKHYKICLFSYQKATNRFVIFKKQINEKIKSLVTKAFLCYKLIKITPS